MSREIEVSAFKSEMRAVIEALEVLERFYPGARLIVPDQGSNGRSSLPESRVHSRPLPRQVAPGSNRGMVSTVLAEGWTSIAEIAATTKLSKKQIYGVLTAPDFKDQIERRDLGEGPEKEYRLKSAKTQ
jgi:hypothetical protein